MLPSAMHPRFSLLALGITLSACLSDQKKLARFDEDGDGFYTELGLQSQGVAGIPDCDDTNPDVHPNAVEVCNGVDDNCDDTVDNGATDAPTWYGDGDGDGTGGDVAFAACEAPTGFVAETGDCDDEDKGVNPAVVDDSCDGLDQNCDGVADDATTTSPWFADEDGDGYGSDATVDACAAPVGFVDEGGDCDDANSGAFPGAIELCDGEDGDCDGTPEVLGIVYADIDQDGFGERSSGSFGCALGHWIADDTDCDDTTADRSPAAIELCNSKDDDCDGLVDESGTGSVARHRDADGDGFGEIAITQACAAAQGFVADATDCDDDANAVHPGAVERCNTLDDDCDTLVDGADSAVTGDGTWYVDNDGDGHGKGAGTTSCTPVSGAVLSNDDCDDLDPDVHPGALEVCDRVDDDCDGLLDDGLATSVWYIDGDGDTYGRSSNPTSACAQPIGTTRNGADCDDAKATVKPSAAEVRADGIDQDCDSYDTLVEQDFEGGTPGAALADGFTVSRGGVVFSDTRAAHGDQALGFSDAPASQACLSFTRAYADLLVTANLWHPGDDALDTEASLLFRPSTTTVEAVGGGVLNPTTTNARAYVFEDGTTGTDHGEAVVTDVDLPGWHALSVQVTGANATTCVDDACATLPLALHPSTDQRVFCVSVSGEGAEQVVIDDLTVRAR